MFVAEINEKTEALSPAFTHNVLLNILQQQSGLVSINIHKIDFSPASKKGEAYLSQVTRLAIDGTGKRGSDGNEETFQASFVVKSIPNSPSRTKTFRSFDFFKNETVFYNTIWPQLDAFQKSKNLLEPYYSIPICFTAVQNGKDDFIVLDDLCEKGYFPLSRTDALDLDLTAHILKNFAKFHAISVAYREQNPIEFQNMVKSVDPIYFTENSRGWYINAFKKYCIVCKDAAEKELPPQYLEKIVELTSGDLYGEACKLLAEESKTSAIVHADCWGPNFLLQGLGDKRKMMLIDFQIMRYTSLVIDIFFFMYACVDPDISNKHWDYLLKEYYNTFSDTMIKLGSTSNITFEMLQADMKKYGLCGFAICMDAVTMCLLDDENVIDMDTIEGDEEIPLEKIWIIEPIKNQERRKRLADFLKHAIDNGFV